MSVPEEWLPDPARGEQNPAYRPSGPVLLAGVSETDTGYKYGYIPCVLGVAPQMAHDIPPQPEPDHAKTCWCPKP